MRTKWQRLDHYSALERRLRKRYEREDGTIVISVGGIASRYHTLESLACVKYLECDPTKLGVPGLENVRINRANV